MDGLMKKKKKKKLILQTCNLIRLNSNGILNVIESQYRKSSLTDIKNPLFYTYCSILS